MARLRWPSLKCICIEFIGNSVLCPRTKVTNKVPQLVTDGLVRQSVVCGGSKFAIIRQIARLAAGESRGGVDATCAQFGSGGKEERTAPSRGQEFAPDVWVLHNL